MTEYSVIWNQAQRPMYSLTIVILNDLEEETGGYLQLSFDRVPKQNRNSLAQLGKQYTQWLNKHGVSSKIYYLNNNSSTTINGGVYESLGSIAKTLSMGNDGELWVVLQFYRDQAHADQVRSKMMQDEIIVALGKEFYSRHPRKRVRSQNGFSRLGTQAS